MDLIRIGSFLAELRREKGLTQQALGDRLGVTNKNHFPLGDRSFP